MAKAEGITTDRQCQTAAAHPDGRRKDYRVKAARGLQLRVSATKVWSLLYRAPDGRQARINLGEYPAMGLTDATIEAQRYRFRIKDGEDPARKPKPAPPALTFAELADHYMTGHSEPNVRTSKADRHRLDKRILPAIGQVPAKEVTPEDVIRIVDEHAKSSRSQADRTKILISSIYNWGRDERLVDINPAARIRPRYERKRRTRVFSAEELVDLWRYLNREGGTESQKTARTIIKLAMLLGQRRRQIAGARVEELHDLDLAATWRIPAARNKNKDALHVVPLPPLAAALFHCAVQSAKHGYAFPSTDAPGKPIHPDTVTHEFEDVCRTLNIIGATLHDARHTFKTGLARLRVNKEVRDRITSHKSGTADMSEWYDHYDYADEMREGLQRWETELLRIVERTS